VDVNLWLVVLFLFNDNSTSLIANASKDDVAVKFTVLMHAHTHMHINAAIEFIQF